MSSMAVPFSAARAVSVRLVFVSLCLCLFVCERTCELKRKVGGNEGGEHGDALLDDRGNHRGGIHVEEI